MIKRPKYSQCRNLCQRFLGTTTGGITATTSVSGSGGTGGIVSCGDSGGISDVTSGFISGIIIVFLKLTYEIAAA
jgi:hypothetical protein